MSLPQPIKDILRSTEQYWNNSDTRPAVRENFKKVVQCRTEALGAEVYVSDGQEKTVFHTCKSRACPSCGYRATQLWQGDQWTDLPDIPYAGIVLTMPDALWQIFQKNRHLLHDLPVLGAAVIQQWAKVQYGARVLIMVFPHTFGRRLNFNPHLHLMASSVGLSASDNRVTEKVHFDKKALMRIWRYAVITYLRAALTKGLLSSELTRVEAGGLLRSQYERWWNVHVARLVSKSHFLRYAGRYVRRPPIAQHRFTAVTEQHVEFLTKDLKEKRVVQTRYSLSEFVEKLAEHVPDHYRHAIRYFGLWAPRSKGQAAAALFLLLGQKRRHRPRRLKWANSIRKSFGTDPLIDRHGHRMRWCRRLKPINAAL